MTYRHKREKCAQNTKEILEEVLKIEREEYGCLDCAETIRVANPMEKILAEEASLAGMKSPSESIMSEVTSSEETSQEVPADNLETYLTSEEVDAEDVDSTLKTLSKKKKRSYVEFRKDIRR